MADQLRARRRARVTRRPFVVLPTSPTETSTTETSPTETSTTETSTTETSTTETSPTETSPTETSPTEVDQIQLVPGDTGENMRIITTEKSR